MSNRMVEKEKKKYVNVQVQHGIIGESSLQRAGFAKGQKKSLQAK